MWYHSSMARRREEPIQTTGGLRIRPLYIILFFVLMTFILGGVFLSQQTQLRSIAEQKEILQIDLDDLKIEEERLERMLEYMQSDDYKRQYAREKLGYLYPNDIKFVEPPPATPEPPIETPTPPPNIAGYTTLP